MIRCAAIILLLALVGCADQSKGAALNECRIGTISKVRRHKAN